MESKYINIKVHRPSSREKTFFLFAGVMTRVPLTIFIEQYLESLLSGFSVLLATVISVVIFAPSVEELSKAYPYFIDTAKPNGPSSTSPCAWD